MSAIPSSDIIKATRPLLVSEADAQLLYNLLEGHKRGVSLRADLERIMHEFKDSALQLRELVKTARANGFWEEDKTANEAINRIGGPVPSVEKVRATVQKIVSKKKHQRSAKARKLRKSKGEG